MSSVPNKPTFLDSYKNINETEKKIPQNNIIEKYKREIKYIEEEIRYWKNEDEFNPSDSKKKKIRELEIELKNVENIYIHITQKCEIH
jgi:hypothetical protein